MGVRYIFLSEFSGPLHMIGRWTESGTDPGSSASARRCATGRQKPYMHARIHAAQPSGAFRGAKYLRRRTHTHADRTAELGNRRAQVHRPPGQRRRRPRGDRLPGPLQDVHPAVRSHPPSQHGPSRGRLETEHLINAPLKKDLKEVGQDIKVMGVRHDDAMRLTVAAAFVDKYVPDKDHYQSVVEELRERLLDNAVKFTDRTVKVDINTGDNYDSGIFYLTVTGLSWENGDDGSVGRGNRVSGLITPYRPMSMEAAAGKNPVTHVGKLYNLLSFDIADRLVREHEGKAKEVWVRIVSKIGNPIDEPPAATAQIIPEKGTHLSSLQRDAEALIDEELEKIYKMTERIVDGKVHCF